MDKEYKCEIGTRWSKNLATAGETAYTERVFIRGMDTYCGQFATIKGITTSGNYYLDICNYIFDRQTLRTIEECDEGEGENEGVPICPMMTFDEAVAFNT